MSRSLPLDLINLRAGPIPEAMASPPTITAGVLGANSTVVPTATVFAPTIQPAGGKLTVAHGTVSATNPDNFRIGSTYYTSSGRNANFIGWRFMADAPVFDFVVLPQSGGTYMVFVDGQPISRDTSLPCLGGYPSGRYTKVDFGADVLTYAAEQPYGIPSGGTGYAIGDTITLSGGTGTPAVLTVSNVSAGAVTAVVVTTRGSYSAVPANPVGQASTSGAGTGATFNLYFGQRHTTRKWRKIEILLYATAPFGGINVPAGCAVLPWPTSGERWLFAGDSYTAGSLTAVLGQSWAGVCAQSLGVFDTMTPYGLGGTGYVKVNGSYPNFLTQVPDIVALQPTRMVIGTGLNDIGQSLSNIQANVAAAYSQLAVQLPNCLFFVLGPWSQASTSNNTARQQVSDTIKAAFESVVPASRGVFVDVVGDGLLVPDGTAAPAVPGTGNTGQYLASDLSHPSTAGHIYLGYGAANGIACGAQKILAAI